MSIVHKRSKPMNALVYVFLFIVAAFQLFPLVILFINSMRTDVEIKQMPIGITAHPTLQNYADTWVRADMRLRFEIRFSWEFAS